MITLYTTHCPKCEVVKKKLTDANIEFEVCDDMDIMESKGFMAVPMLDVNGKLLDFKQTIDWINSGGIIE